MVNPHVCGYVQNKCVCVLKHVWPVGVVTSQTVVTRSTFKGDHPNSHLCVYLCACFIFLSVCLPRNKEYLLDFSLSSTFICVYLCTLSSLSHGNRNRSF